MNTPNNLIKNQTQTKTVTNVLLVVTALFIGTIAMAVGLLAIEANTGAAPVQIVSSFLALDNVHIWWYITRAAGLMSYLLVWLSTLWGFAISSKILDPFLDRMFTYDFHEHLSLLSLGFVIIHLVVLLLDKVQPMQLAEVLIPFVSTYRPFWTGVGIIAFYLSILVTVTFYIRSWISMKTFRAIHYLSIAAYVGALFHGLYAGTDSALTWTQMMYWGTFLSTVFFCVYWLVTLRLRKGASTQQLQTQPK
jgi:methionine sulfoxide reductase heme-binding subunit